MKNVGNVQNNKNNVLLNSSVILHTFEGGGQRKLDIILDNLYPVGSIYISTNNTNPSNYFGGVWQQIKDVFLLACGNHSNGSTGGAENVTLTVNQIPSHSHTLGFATQNSGSSYDMPIRARAYGSAASNYSTSAVGGSQAHNNMPPYLAVYMWERIV